MQKQMGSTVLVQQTLEDIENRHPNNEQYLQEFVETYNHDSLSFTPHKWFAQMQSGRTTLPGLVGFMVGALGHENIVADCDSQVGKVLETEVGNELKRMVGYQNTKEDEWKESTALLVSGGTEGNHLALIIARNAVIYQNYQIYIPQDGMLEVYKKGINPIIIIPNTVHYSFKKIANCLGLGEKCLVEVNTIEFRTDPKDLEKKLFSAESNNQHPIAVVSVFGTTETGACDKLDEIYSVIKKYREQTGRKLHWHIDAAYGGPFLTLAKFQNYLPFTALADSITMDPHKMLWCLLGVGAVIFKNAQTLRFLSTDAPYIQDKVPKDMTTEEFLDGMYHHRCAVKLLGSQSAAGPYSTYLTLKMLGRESIRLGLTKTLEISDYLRKQLESIENKKGKIEIINPEKDLNVVVWRFAIKGATQKVIDNFNMKIYELFQKPDMKDHRNQISKTQLKQKQNAIVNRACITSPLTTTVDIDYFIKIYQQILEKELGALQLN